MRTIKDFDDFVAAIKDITSEDSIIQNEAKSALVSFRSKYPVRFEVYEAHYETIKPAEQNNKGRKTAYDKEKYIKEHPEINVNQLRKAASERLKKGPHNLGMHFEIPSWITQEDVLSSLNQLTISDLITASGKPVPRQTLLRKCIKLTIAQGRINEIKLRDDVLYYFGYYYRKEIITLQSPYLYEPVQRMLKEEATIEELANVSEQWSVNVDKLVQLINSREIKVSDEDIENYKRKTDKQARKKAKKEKLKAKKKPQNNRP